VIVVLLGGTAFSDGEGRVMRSFFGALIVMALTMGMLTMIPAYFQTLVLGATLLLAAASNHLVSRRKPPS
jgi:ribose transport system permease protein